MLIALVLSLLPSPIHKWVRRRLGQAIDPSAQIGFGSLIVGRKIVLGPSASIGPLALVRVHSLALASGAKIGPLSIVSAHTVRIGRSSRIASGAIVLGPSDKPRSTLTIGEHSRIFPLCWVEPGHGVSIGDHVGIGGHGLIFTHGSWSNFFRGAPVSMGPVIIEDRVWLPWRVFVMPNVVIGENAIVAAGSVVTRDVPPGALAAGAPARIVKENAYIDVDQDEFGKRARQALKAFIEDYPQFASYDMQVAVRPISNKNRASTILTSGIECREAQELAAGGISILDLTEERAWLSEGDDAGLIMSSWISTFGVRIEIQ